MDEILSTWAYIKLTAAVLMHSFPYAPSAEGVFTCGTDINEEESIGTAPNHAGYLVSLSVSTSTAAPIKSDRKELATAVAAIKSGDVVQGSNLLRPLAERGQGEAQAHLRSILKTADDKEAMMWLQRSTDNSYLPSIHNLAMMYLHGVDVTENPQRALEYLKRAAAGNMPAAQVLLGLLYRNGPNALQDDVEAAR